MLKNDYMFLDTVKLAIPLAYNVARPQDPYGLKMWDIYRGNGILEYRVNKQFRRKQQEGYFEYLPIVKYRELYCNGILNREIVVEFSIPKLVHCNNFMPVSMADLETVYARLLDILQNVYHFRQLNIDSLKVATLSRIDCSAVVKFKTHIGLQRAMDRIRKAELDGRLDMDEPSFSPTSHGISISCGSWQFCFYNKTIEYKSSIRAVQKSSFYPDDSEIGGTDIKDSCRFPLVLRGKLKYEQKWDLSILPSFVERSHEQGAEFMQCELRLNTRDRIRRAIKRLGEEQQNLTLDGLLDKQIPLKILRYHWRMVLSGLPRNDIQVISMKDIYDRLMESGLPPKSLFEMAGRICIFKEYNMQELKDLYAAGHGRSGWQRLKESISRLPKFSNETDPVQPITDAIFGLPKDCFDANNEPQYGFSYPICITITLCTKQSLRNCYIVAPYKIFAMRVFARAPPHRCI